VNDCVFCAIVRGDAERSVVYEDDLLLVIMDLHPVNSGHALAFPKRHLAYLAELDKGIAAALFAAALRTAAALRGSGIRCEGVNLFVADGEVAGQEVFHVHLHVIPRFSGDPFRVEREGGPSEAASRDELDSAAEQLRTAWGSVA
jgi:histidine triad (HIT) family protein